MFSSSFTRVVDAWKECHYIFSLKECDCPHSGTGMISLKLVVENNQIHVLYEVFSDLFDSRSFSSLDINAKGELECSLIGDIQKAIPLIYANIDEWYPTLKDDVRLKLEKINEVIPCH